MKQHRKPAKEIVHQQISIPKVQFNFSTCVFFKSENRSLQNVVRQIKSANNDKDELVLFHAFKQMKRELPPSILWPNPIDPDE